VNEGTTKYLKRKDRKAGQHRFKDSTYFQTEYNDEDRAVFKKFGTIASQMVYFTRKLREFDVDDMDYVYQIHCDKRWDSLIGMVEAKRLYNVAYTSSVDRKSRYHICYQLGVPEGKQRSNRGKYRSASCCVGEVKVNCVLWADNKLVGFASTQGGSKQIKDTRRQGRHEVIINCPQMVVTRGQNFRAVDSNDQIRLSRYRFHVISRNKAWPVANWGIIELIVINIFLIVRLTPNFLNINQLNYRWKLLTELVTVADQWELISRGEDPADFTDESSPQVNPNPRQPTCFTSNNGRLHHLVQQPEYVTAQQLVTLHNLHENDRKKNSKEETAYP